MGSTLGSAAQPTPDQYGCGACVPVGEKAMLYILSIPGLPHLLALGCKAGLPLPLSQSHHCVQHDSFLLLQKTIYAEALGAAHL